MRDGGGQRGRSVAVLCSLTCCHIHLVQAGSSAPPGLADTLLEVRSRASVRRTTCPPLWGTKHGRSVSLLTHIFFSSLQTPTYILAIMFLIFTTIAVSFDWGLHLMRGVFRANGRHGLVEALDKVRRKKRAARCVGVWHCMYEAHPCVGGSFPCIAFRVNHASTQCVAPAAADHGADSLGPHQLAADGCSALGLKDVRGAGARPIFVDHSAERRQLRLLHGPHKGR